MRQLPLVERILAEKAFKKLSSFLLDYDREKAFLREHRVRWQSTLIVFRGKVEKGRSTADLSPWGIRQLLEKAL